MTDDVHVQENGDSVPKSVLPRVAVLIPYFGEWPPWYSLFERTCAANPTVDWLLFSDREPVMRGYDNVHFVRMSLQDFNELASSRLGATINATDGFKLCDYRPAYGQIFSDFLSSYDFWGWGDIDVVYGNLRRFFSARSLAKFDVLSPRIECTAGELTLLRNKAEINLLYQRSRDYERVFLAKDNYNFCEAGFFKNKPIESFTQVVVGAAREGKIRAKLRTVLRTDRKLRGSRFQFCWQQGRLIDLNDGREVLLYHFIDQKKNPDFIIRDVGTWEKGFLIDPNGVSELEHPCPAASFSLKGFIGEMADEARRIRTLLRRGA